MRLKYPLTIFIDKIIPRLVNPRDKLSEIDRLPTTRTALTSKEKMRRLGMKINRMWEYGSELPVRGGKRLSFRRTRRAGR